MKNIKEMLAKWRSLEVTKLQEELQSLLAEQFKLKMQHAIGELKEVHKLKDLRRNIARILGILQEKNAKT